jgi:thioredoxin-like negative regulator of GroEL
MTLLRCLVLVLAAVFSTMKADDAGSASTDALLPVPAAAGSVTPITDPAAWLAQIAAASASAPLLIEVGSSACGACQLMAPEITALLAERRDLRHIHVDLDLHPELAEILAVRSIPSVRIWWQGEERDRRAGFQELTQLRALVESCVGEPVTP